MIDNRYSIRCLSPDLPNLPELLPYLERIDRNKWYTNFGPLVLEYESRLADITGAGIAGGQCVTLASGTAALELAITALDLPKGARVLLPSFTFPATLLAVLRCGLQPVFSDVDANDWTLTPAIARRALQYGRYALILPVACFGLALPDQDWDAFTQETGISVIMDAAAALGSQKVGKTTSAVFSLHATKPLGIGEGGVFAAADPDLAERVRRMSNFGFDQGTIGYSIATNAKLSEYAAAVGLAQLERWPVLSARRCSVWAAYRAALQSLPEVGIQPFADLTPPAVLSVCLVADAEQAARKLAKTGIETRRWYAPPLHRHPLFTGVEQTGSLPVTEKLHRNSLGLPFHAFLTDAEVLTVADKLQNIGE